MVGGRDFERKLPFRVREGRGHQRAADARADHDVGVALRALEQRAPTKGHGLLGPGSDGSQQQRSHVGGERMIPGVERTDPRHEPVPADLEEETAGFAQRVVERKPSLRVDAHRLIAAGHEDTRVGGVGAGQRREVHAADHVDSGRVRVAGVSVSVVVRVALDAVGDTGAVVHRVGEAVVVVVQVTGVALGVAIEVLLVGVFDLHAIVDAVGHVVPVSIGGQVRDATSGQADLLQRAVLVAETLEIEALAGVGVARLTHAAVGAGQARAFVAVAGRGVVHTRPGLADLAHGAVAVESTLGRGDVLVGGVRATAQHQAHPGQQESTHDAQTSCAHGFLYGR